MSNYRISWKKDESVLSLFILCLFFLEGENKMERESNGDKKMHVVPFHPGRKPFTRKYIFFLLQLLLTQLMIINWICHTKSESDYFSVYQKSLKRTFKTGFWVLNYNIRKSILGAPIVFLSSVVETLYNILIKEIGKDLKSVS